jgi:hypothetical protein
VNKDLPPLAEPPYNLGIRRLPVDLVLDSDLAGLSSNYPRVADNGTARAVAPGPT